MALSNKLKQALDAIYDAVNAKIDAGDRVSTVIVDDNVSGNKYKMFIDTTNAPDVILIKLVKKG